jgi:LysM repeat protein
MNRIAATAHRWSTALPPWGKAVWRWRVAAVPVVLAIALTASVSGGGRTITIQPGDTLSAIALRYHTSVAALVRLNHLPGAGNLIYAGQTLRLPGSHGRAHHASRTVTHYTVVSGDSLYGIAARFHANPDVIARRNHLPKSLVVMIGQRLLIPHHVRHQAQVHAPTGGVPGTPTAAASHDRWVLAHRHEPTRDQVAAIIRSTAGRWGLDPRLALAVSWQESGFNMRVVSPVDAIGAMQVMPYTGAYLASDVVHRSLNLYNARDNVTAGVALLSVLTHEASSTRQAIAGYYQGLQSVRDHGMLPSTKQYVANVMALRERF